ncbi:Uncharacterised protein [Escherichia coli]|nr:Uncharacterised protein [Escherichia coli]
MPRVRAVVQHLRGHRVAEDVAGSRLVDTGFLPDGFPADLRQRSPVQPLAVVRHEQMPAVGALRQVRPHAAQIARYPLQCHMPHRNDPILLSLALAHVHHAALEVHI